jgi:hypothetical protein
MSATSDNPTSFPCPVGYTPSVKKNRSAADNYDASGPLSSGSQGSFPLLKIKPHIFIKSTPPGGKGFC